ncbi:hypothetical protein P168DRAFT_285105 [Aspergillus campestris IBT 28561]|uniref:N-acetylglucosaminylphosphatidylinositol deacetylase n=1 Tax=Aspergillus campestris (strain IBT 28561) TaxID=1392248 RepID=A0A2I1CS12_ASPC2|nr:uncharacterized protein P168DRAFT_285105 [Aspergillus campestris IBT 28561]PKY00410.1 hypothetical protein P168DRAFT_285105 [Aspergillus campestris IBT 28561]
MQFKMIVYTIALMAAIGLSFAQTLNIVAHQDDDLLFMSPDLIREIVWGRAVRTVFLTAGDAGLGPDYWMGRQIGSLAAYSRMASASNIWDERDLGINDYDISLFTLRDMPQISLVFMHMPDGGLGGIGYDSTGFESLMRLWEEDIDSIGTVDGSNTRYTRDGLLDVLTQMIEGFEPDRINTLDYVNSIGDGDHPDHYTSGFFADHASQAANGEFDFTGYMGYGINSLPVNLDASDIEDKQNIFYEYGAYDIGTCFDAVSCSGRPESGWLMRQYTV